MSKSDKKLDAKVEEAAVKTSPVKDLGDGIKAFPILEVGCIVLVGSTPCFVPGVRTVPVHNLDIDGIQKLVKI